MTKSFRTAAIAALTFASGVAIGSFGAATAFGASDVADAQRDSLLPVSVVEDARTEGQTPVDYTIIPEIPTAPEAGSDGPRPGSLDAWVAHHAGVATRNREEECLAAAVYFEARSEPLQGQLAVARVIINRAKSGRFPASLCGVVLQPGQFSFVRGGGFPPIARGSRDWQEAIGIARVAREDLWRSPVEKALFFHARHVSPGWRLTRIAAVGNHIFYR